jgi:hypothetical protein
LPSVSVLAPDGNRLTGQTVVIPDSDLSRLFHSLNNQLGVILANAELLEKRLVEEPHRARAGQVVTSVLEAMSTIQKIRQLAESSAGR